MALNSKATRSGPLHNGLRQRPDELYNGSEFYSNPKRAAAVCGRGQMSSTMALKCRIAENIALPLELSRQSTRSVSGRSWAQMPQVAFACLFLDSIPGRASIGAIIFVHSLAAGRCSLSKRST